VKTLDFGRLGSPDPGQSDAIFARPAHLRNNPESAGFEEMMVLAKGRRVLFSLATFDEARAFSRSSGAIEVTPIQKTLRKVMALRVQGLALGDERQGDVDLGRIEAEIHATGLCNEDTTHGR
jgi:hypothetical protein